MNKSYSEMMKYDTIHERREYLKLFGSVGESTFGSERHLCQDFYKTRRWRDTRDIIIIRDDASDLGVEGYDINSMILVHHINTITIDDVLDDADCLYDPENLVCTTKTTHDYIHYGRKPINDYIIERTRNDTAPWLM